MRLTWVSGCAIVHSGPEPGAGMTALVARASAPNEMAVVVASHTLRLLPPMMNELADLLVEQLPPRCNRLRLVAWNSGCLHDDRPASAYQLATRLGIEVFAVCSRYESKTDTPGRRKAREDLATKRFDEESKRYLRQLRKNAMIERGK